MTRRGKVSVRGRLTALVVGVVAGLGVVAATVGVDAIERQLIADEIAVAGDDQLIAVLELSELGESVDLIDEFVELDVFEEPEDPTELFEELAAELDVADGFSVAAELENLALGLDELRRAGALDDVVDATGVDGTLPVLTYFGLVALVDATSGAIIGVAPLEAVDGEVVIPQSAVDELIFLTVDVDVIDLVGDDGFDEIPDADLRFDTRSAGDLEYVVVADVSDIERGLDRIRTIVWFSVPLLALLGGMAAWALTGRALRPVHAITRRVGEISSGNLHERVPTPGTGDEIDELAETMNSMLDRLEVDDRRLRRFVSDASHELRSPVAVLHSDAEVARSSPGSTTVVDLADGVLVESQRLQRIVEDLLVLARGEERLGGARAVEVDVDDVVLAEARRRRRVEVDTSHVTAGRILATPEGVARVVTHLLDNAARHAEARVEVRLGPDGDEVVLHVDDDGPGVPVDEREHVFARFTRLDDARTRDRGGAGLGLAVVAESVHSMGGHVEVDDAPIGGARFTVRWPTPAPFS